MSIHEVAAATGAVPITTSDVTAKAASASGTTFSSPAIAAEEIDFQIRLDDLPRELYDMIYHFTIKAQLPDLSIKAWFEPGRTPCDLSCRCGRASYAESLKILRISQVIREKYAEDFYRQRTFNFECITQVRRWLPSVPEAHRLHIHALNVVLSPSWDDHRGSLRWISDYQKIFEGHFEKAIARKVFKRWPKTEAEAARMKRLGPNATAEIMLETLACCCK